MQGTERRLPQSVEVQEGWARSILPCGAQTGVDGLLKTYGALHGAPKFGSRDSKTPQPIGTDSTEHAAVGSATLG